MKKMDQGKTKYYLLMESLKESMMSGEIKPGEKLPSENQLTKLYSVSRHTVRKALSLLCEEGYISVEHGVGSFCTNSSMIGKETKNIAVVTTYISYYIFPRLIQGVDNVLTENGYSIILKNTKNNKAMEINCLEDVIHKNVDGVIIEPSKSQIYSKHLEIYSKLEEYKIPYVFIHGTYPQLKDKPSIVIDDEKGMYLLTKYLIQLGHKDFIGIFKSDDIQGIKRHIGFVKALNEHGILYHPERIIWYHTEDKQLKPRIDLMELIKQGCVFDSVVCYNDQIAYYVMETLKELNISVPEEVSVTGFDNSYVPEPGGKGITSVEHPKERLGALAAELLLEKIKGIPDSESKVPRVLTPKLVIKDTCKNRKRTT